MPRSTEKRYTVLLTDVDRIKVRQVRTGHDVRGFSVQYEALIEGRWRKITRFDNSHNLVHRHVYYPYKHEHKYAMDTQDSNKAFTEAQAVVKQNFMKLREAYIILLNKGGEASNE